MAMHRTVNAGRKTMGVQVPPSQPHLMVALKQASSNLGGDGDFGLLQGSSVV